jgi:exosortase
MTGRRRVGLTPFPPPVLVLCALAGGTLLYASLLRDLAVTWRDSPYYSHAIVVPLFSAYAWWTARHDLGPPAPHGIAGLLTAALALAVIVGAPSVALRALAIPVGVSAVLFLSHGPHAARRLAFPVAFLLFVVPLPAAAVEYLSPVLQRLAAGVAEHALRLLAIPVSRKGLELQIGADTLEITEACNGLRFLIVMAVVGVALAWAVGRTWAARLAIVAGSLVVAILANVLRVTVTAVLSYAFGVATATGPAHLVYGKAVYAAVGAAWLLTLWVTWGRSLDPRQAST